MREMKRQKVYFKVQLMVRQWRGEWWSEVRVLGIQVKMELMCKMIFSLSGKLIYFFQMNFIVQFFSFSQTHHSILTIHDYSKNWLLTNNVHFFCLFFNRMYLIKCLLITISSCAQDIVIFHTN
jgi:hypothetical protein